MPRTIFISLPVTDLDKSKAFYAALGFTIHPGFGGDDAACMVWSETISIMLIPYGKWSELTTRPIPPPTSSEMGITLSFDSREAVDAASEAACAHGGTLDVNPVQDHGVMYTRDLLDPDGHVVGAMWMDPAAGPAQ